MRTRTSRFIVQLKESNTRRISLFFPSTSTIRSLRRLMAAGGTAFLKKSPLGWEKNPPIEWWSI